MGWVLYGLAAMAVIPGGEGMRMLHSQLFTSCHEWVVWGSEKVEPILWRNTKTFKNGITLALNYHERALMAITSRQNLERRSLPVPDDYDFDFYVGHKDWCRIIVIVMEDPGVYIVLQLPVERFSLFCLSQYQRTCLYWTHHLLTGGSHSSPHHPFY